MAEGRWTLNPRFQRRTNIWLSLIALVMFTAPALGAERGEEAYLRGTCNACHTIGGGRLVGPDLEGITTKRSRDWLFQFIKASGDMIAAGDADAIAIFEEYGRLPMPNAPLSDDEINDVISYLETTAGSNAEASVSAREQPVRASEQPVNGQEPEVEQALQAPNATLVALGGAYFDGTEPLANGGATCNACHHVDHATVVGGGSLARDLTGIVARMGSPGVEAIVVRPPFPAMDEAYADHPLESDEVAALVAFLASDETSPTAFSSGDYGTGLFVAGISGAAVVFGMCGLGWRKRRRGSINQPLFDRQRTTS